MLWVETGVQSEPSCSFSGFPWWAQEGQSALHSERHESAARCRSSLALLLLGEGEVGRTLCVGGPTESPRLSMQPPGLQPRQRAPTHLDGSAQYGITYCSYIKLIFGSEQHRKV